MAQTGTHSLFVTERGTSAVNDTCTKREKEVLSESGIDPGMYTPHYIRSTSSWCLEKGYPLDVVSAQSDWALNNAIMQHYCWKVKYSFTQIDYIRVPTNSIQGRKPVFNNYKLNTFDTNKQALLVVPIQKHPYLGSLNPCPISHHIVSI